MFSQNSFFNVHWGETCSFPNRKRINTSWGKKPSCAVKQIGSATLPRINLLLHLLLKSLSHHQLLDDIYPYFTSMLKLICFNVGAYFSFQL